MASFLLRTPRYQSLNLTLQSRGRVRIHFQGGLVLASCDDNHERFGWGNVLPGPHGGRQMFLPGFGRMAAASWVALG